MYDIAEISILRHFTILDEALLFKKLDRIIICVGKQIVDTHWLRIVFHIIH